MTPKEKLTLLVEKMTDDITLEEVLYRLDLFRGVELGVRDMEEGRVMDHDKLFEKLLDTYL